jgi:hypothetical protein
MSLKASNWKSVAQNAAQGQSITLANTIPTVGFWSALTRSKLTSSKYGASRGMTECLCFTEIGCAFNLLKLSATHAEKNTVD